MAKSKKKPAKSPKTKKKKGRSSGSKKGRVSIISLIFAAFIILLMAIWIWNPMLYVNLSDSIKRYYRYKTAEVHVTYAETAPESVLRTQKNYGAEIDKLAAQFNLSPEFLKALIILECSGLKNIKPRFERHIYHRLVNVKSGKLDRLENIRQADLKDASDESLKNMAKSWGPFQLMGYKCIWLDIPLNELRGDKALYWAVKWIDMTYGDYIRNGQYKDAFHMHNTGRPYPESGPPKTYDPKYVPNGLMYMKYFKDYKITGEKST
jgi:hypothetical protein